MSDPTDARIRLTTPADAKAIPPDGVGWDRGVFRRTEPSRSMQLWTRVVTLLRARALARSANYIVARVGFPGWGMISAAVSG